MIKKIIYISIVLVILTLLGAWAQVPARVKGLENNTEYMSLLVQESDLQHREDSIVKVVEQTRLAFRNDVSNRTKYGEIILDLESDIFDVRNQIGIIAGKINSIEQDFVISNLDNISHNNAYNTPSNSHTPTTTVVENQHQNFVYNNYFKDNLSPNDYSVLLKSQDQEQSVVNYLKIFSSNYKTIDRLNESYKYAVTATQGDSIYSKYKLLTAINNKIEDSIAIKWAYIYDNKSYAYNYLLDKTNNNAKLSELDTKMQKLRQQRADSRGIYMSDIVADYRPYKLFTLDYEIALADILGLNKSADSLKVARKFADSLNLELTKIVIEERVFIDYQQIEIASPAKYNSNHPIPLCAIYSKGKVFRILLGTYTKTQQPSIFKGVNPIGYIKGDDGRYSYYAGGYRELIQAEDDVSMLKKLGFKRPEIVVWDQGIYSNLSAEPKPESTSGILYQLEISGSGDALSANIKAAIDNASPGKEITRIPTADGLSYTFIVGTFDSKTIVEQLIQTLTAEQSELMVKIVEIK